ncbi:hypothetical protein WJX73_001550 [Symbiochloris irregularis]|uniref:Glycosyltransferase n=1 Tax=Symbiochloris irregularis TaxID=706552 RepID=A0AAW1PDW9_9CHLO
MRLCGAPQDKRVEHTPEQDQRPKGGSSVNIRSYLYSTRRACSRRRSPNKVHSLLIRRSRKSVSDWSCRWQVLLGHAQQWQSIPSESTVTARPRGHRRYHTLHNVLLWEDRVHFYVPDELADAAPDELHRAPTQQELKVEVLSKHNRSHFPQTCQRWIEQPAVMFSGMGMDTLNVYHTMFDSFALIFNTVAALELFNVSDMIARGRAPTREEAQLVLIQRHGASWFNVLGLQMLYDYLTPDQWTFPHGAGYCYRTLVVGLETHLSPYGAALNEEDQQLKYAEMARYVQFVTFAQAHIDAQQGVDVAALQQQRYPSAEVSLLHFESFPTKSEGFMAVARTNVLIGVHGAGMTNIMFLQPGMSVVQLIPYGWRHRDGSLIGASIFEQIATNSNCSHFVWENKHANMSWLAKGPTLRERPDEALTQAFGHLGKDFGPYQFQDTQVELESFLAVTDEAVQAASQALHLSSIK